MSAPAELDEPAVVAWWHRQRAAQGLPDEITDPGVISRVVTLAFAGDEDGDGRGRPAA